MSNIIEGITKDLKAIPKNLKAKAGGMDTKKLVIKCRMEYALTVTNALRLKAVSEYTRH